MRYILPLLVLVFPIILIQTSRAMQLDSTYFDPPDPSQVNSYQQAVKDLETELTITATDSNGNELFRAMPIPLELAELRAQLAIHELGSDDKAKIDAIIAQANHDKPTSDSFEVVITGKPEWVGRDVGFSYRVDEQGAQETQISTIRVEGPITLDDGSMQTVWRVTASGMAQLGELRIAPETSLVVGINQNSVNPIALDCGFWREYQLFDLIGMPGYLR